LDLTACFDAILFETGLARREGGVPRIGCWPGIRNTASRHEAEGCFLLP
jgi:hypothetical protein